MGNRQGNSGNGVRFYFGGLQNHWIVHFRGKRPESLLRLLPRGFCENDLVYHLQESIALTWSQGKQRQVIKNHWARGSIGTACLCLARLASPTSWRAEAGSFTIIHQRLGAISLHHLSGADQEQSPPYPQTRQVGESGVLLLFGYGRHTGKQLSLLGHYGWDRSCQRSVGALCPALALWPQRLWLSSEHLIHPLKARVWLQIVRVLFTNGSLGLGQGTQRSVTS